MKYIFIIILAVYIYAMWRGDLFFAGAAFSPLLIIAGIWLNGFAIRGREG